jgi:SAM-dependent methyltransferase
VTRAGGSGEAHWFEPLARHLGRAYLRYSFTKGTVREVDALVDLLGLRAGMRVLDVGCGPGRHSHELARRGMAVLGVDISERFVELAAADAPPGARFLRLDARELAFEVEFDAAVCLCQGAFGMMTAPEDDRAVLGGIARALAPGGRLALTAFNGYFVVRHQAVAPDRPDGSRFDAETGVNHERTEIRSETGEVATADLWTGCYTPRELRLLAELCGFQVDGLWGAEPGDYRRRPPSVDLPEHLLVATRRG